MRLLEIIIPATDQAEARQVLQSAELEPHLSHSAGDQQVVKVLAEEEQSKDLLAQLEKHGQWKVTIYAIEGSLPKPKVEKSSGEQIKLGRFISLSKEELYHDIDSPVDLSTNFILMVVLSSFVAGIGILRDNVAVLIGAMVIAPFLGPNMSMAFGTTLGDLKIIRKSIITGLVATAIALAISILWGFLSTKTGGITRDPDIEYQDIILALICGFAGVIAVVGGKGSSLVGVMVAAALLPPLMRSGLLLGGGFYRAALNSFLIFCTYIVCLNIAGIVTFYLAGIRPQRWWEKETANQKTRQAFILWTLALVILVGIIVLLDRFG